MSAARECPKCGVVYQPDIAVCQECGIDLATGFPVAAAPQPQQISPPTPIPQIPQPIAQNPQDMPSFNLPLHLQPSYMTDPGKVEPPSNEIPEDVTFGRYLAAWIKAALPGFFKASTLIVSLLVGGLGLGFITMALAFVIMFGAGGIFGSVAIGALGFVMYAQAVAWIIAGDFDILPDLLADFVGPQWTIFMLFFVLPIPGFGIMMYLMSQNAI